MPSVIIVHLIILKMRHKILQTLAFACMLAALTLTMMPRQSSAFYFQEQESEESAEKERRSGEKERGRCHLCTVASPWLRHTL